MSNVYEKLKIREYVRNLMRSEAGNKMVMETLVDWAEDKSELLGFPAVEMESICKSSLTEARKQQLILIQTAVGLSGPHRTRATPYWTGSKKGGDKPPFLLVLIPEPAKTRGTRTAKMK